MGLLYDDLTICNFDHVYIPQTNLLALPHTWIECEDIEHTNGYCEQDSFRLIAERLHQRRHPGGITFVGNGNYHYVSCTLLQEVDRPFTLILLDNHTDMMTNVPQHFLSCGSWVVDALLHLPLLRHVILIGTRSDLAAQIDPHFSSYITVFTSQQLRETNINTFISSILSSIHTDTVYISIDKDVLSPEEVETNWDQGVMTLAQLQAIVKALIHCSAKIYGVDICGELPVSPLDVFHQDKQMSIRKNEKVNLEILQTIYS